MDKEKYNELTVSEQLEYFNQELKEGGTIISVSTKIGMNESTVRLRFKNIGYKIDRSINQFVKVDDSEHEKGMTKPVKSKKKKEKKADDNSMTTVTKPVENQQNSLGDKGVTSVIQTFGDKKHDESMTSSVNIKNKEIETNDNMGIEVVKKSVGTKKKSGDDNAETFVVNNALKGNIIELAENHSNIMEMLAWFNSSEMNITNVIDVIEHGIKINLPMESKQDFRTSIRVNDAVWKQFQDFCKDHKEHTQKDLLSQALVMFMERYKNND